MHSVSMQGSGGLGLWFFRIFKGMVGYLVSIGKVENIVSFRNHIVKGTLGAQVMQVTQKNGDLTCNSFTNPVPVPWRPTSF